jgi:hypothetical protein
MYAPGGEPVTGPATCQDLAAQGPTNLPPNMPESNTASYPA